MRISDGSSDVCSSDLAVEPVTVGDRDRRKPPLARSLCNGFGVDRPFEHRVAGKDAKRNEGAVGHRGTLGGRGDSGKGQLSPLLFIRPVDRKSVVEGKSVSVSVDIGRRRILKNKKN